MPIDYLKILSKNEDFAERLYRSPLLNRYSYTQKFNNKLNEVKELKQATNIMSYKEVLFCFFSKDDLFTKLEILIKPHYYFNDNEHNANDFSAIDCINTLTEIKNIFDFNPEELSILNIEFGLKIISPIDIKDLVSCTIYHNKNEFINSSDSLRYSKVSYRYNENGKSNKYKQIKFYAKGLQYPYYTDINTLRIEVKSKERKYIKTLGVNTYADLLKFETYRKLSEVIISESKQILILDIHNKGENLTNKELSKLDEYRNSYYWVKSLQGSRNLFNRHKTKYFEILEKTGNNIHSKLNILIDDKLNKLLKTCAVSTPSIIEKSCAVSDVYIIGNCTQLVKRKCPITGIDLKHEKSDAKYIRTSTINYLKKYNSEIFIILCSRFIPNNGKTPKYETDIVSRLCKNIRNSYYNQTQIKQVGYNSKIYPNQLQLDI